MRRPFVCLSVLTAGALAHAADPTSIEIAGIRYRVQKFDLTTSVTFVDPLNPPFSIGLVECEGTHWLGDDKLLISSNEMDQWGSYANYVVEVDLVKNGAGDVTALQFSRIVVVNDVNVTPAPNDFDLDPGGITINPSLSGLGAGGNLVVADTEQEYLRAYDLQTGALVSTGFTVLPQNDDLEDVLFLDGKFYTVHQDQTPTAPFYSVEVYSDTGAHLQSFPVGSDANPGVFGEPMGLVAIPENEWMPVELRGHGTVLMVVLGDAGPGLHFFDLLGNELLHFPLTSDGTPLGVSLLDPGGQVMQLESGAYDPETGRLFLTQQGVGTGDNYLWVLTPLERYYGAACAGAGDVTPNLAAIGEFRSGSPFTWGIENGLGGAPAVVFLGLGESAIPTSPGCTFNVFPYAFATPILLGGSGAGNGAFSVSLVLPPGTVAGTSIYMQAFVIDPNVPRGYSSTQGQQLSTP